MCFRYLRAGFTRRDWSGSEFSDALLSTECFYIRQASTWPTIAGKVGDGPDGRGHPSAWQGRGLRETQSEEMHNIVKGMS